MGVLMEIPVGVKYNKLTILKETTNSYHPNGRTKRYVEVLCDCGTVCVKAYADVKHGATKTCGTCERENTTLIDLAGLKFNHLTVVNISRKNGRYIYWNCKCDCGNTIEVEGTRLRNSRAYNCGVCGTKLGAYYIGDMVTNNEGCTGEIVSINGRYLGIVFPENKDVVINVDYTNMSTGGFANPFTRSVFGEGYFGVGSYIAKLNGVHTSEYEDWHSMIRRCYDNNFIHHPTYQDVEVYEPWKCYQTFAEWATKQIGFNKKGWHLDKDLLVKGNRIYSPDTCVYVPREINGFIKRKRMNDLPLGVDITYSHSGKLLYRSQGKEDNNVFLGAYDTVEEAFLAYKTHKEKMAKELANKWRSEIDSKAYNALINYTVDITD